jgi:hypothetical protein
MTDAGTRRKRASVLRHRDFRRLLASVGVSGAGDTLYSVALVVYVYDETHSAAWVAATVLVRNVAYVVCATPATALGDRFDRRRWLLMINVLQTGVMAAFTVVAAFEGPAAVAIVLAFGSAALASGYYSAVIAVVPTVVSEDDLGAANAHLATAEWVAMAAGPAIGAAVLVRAGSAAPAFCDQRGHVRCRGRVCGGARTDATRRIGGAHRTHCAHRGRCARVASVEGDSIVSGGLDITKTVRYRHLRENPRATIVIDDLASVEPWQPRGIKVRGRAIVEDDSGRPRIRIDPEVVSSWGLNANAAKRFRSIERRNAS